MPALLVQRFGALLLDIGFIIGLVVLYNIAKHYFLGVDLGTLRPRYVPPHPDMGWSRMERSLIVTGTIVSVMAAMIASPMRGTPGMLAFHLQATDCFGKTLRFPRAFAWVLLAFLPILAANYLVLAGIAMQIPLLHLNVQNWFAINLFSLLVVLQNLWFAAILWRSDKKAIPDIVTRTQVLHYCQNQTGIPTLQRLFYVPFLLLFGTIIAVTGGIATINLIDPPLDPEIRQFQSTNINMPNPLNGTWKNLAAFEIPEKISNFRCVSRYRRFDVYGICTQPQNVAQILEQNRDLLLIYEQDLNATASELSRIHDQYLNQESVALTDLFLAALIVAIETKSASPEAVFQRWLQAEKFWRLAIQKPGFLNAQSRALMHYSHVLYAFPILAASAPDLTVRHAAELQRRFAPVVYDRDFVNGLMAYEYHVYERILSHSLIDYFPLIQPNHTRNQFLPAAHAYQEFFEEDVFRQTFEIRKNLLSLLSDQYQLGILYNPLGTRLRDFAVEGLQSNLYLITAYHTNNGIKQMLRLYVKAQVENIAPADMPAFMERLPPEDTALFMDSKITWSPALNALSFGISNASDLRHYLVF